MAKEEAIGATVEIIKRGPKDDVQVDLQGTVKKVRHLSEKQFKCIYKRKKLLEYLSMNP